jgi:hypothetical protein
VHLKKKDDTGTGSPIIMKIRLNRFQWSKYGTGTVKSNSYMSVGIEIQCLHYGMFGQGMTSVARMPAKSPNRIAYQH